MLNKSYNIYKIITVKSLQRFQPESAGFFCIQAASIVNRVEGDFESRFDFGYIKL